MNIKEVKAIAEIIKKNTGVLFFGGQTKIKLQFKEDLAEYFEKEKNKKPYTINGFNFCKCGRQLSRVMNSRKKVYESHGELCVSCARNKEDKPFNRKQFLEWCG